MRKWGKPQECVRIFCLCVLALTTATVIAQDQQREALPLPIKEALHTTTFPRQVPISISPDGEYVAFTATQPERLTSPEDARYSQYALTGVPAQLQGSDIWIASTRSGEPKNLTEGKGTNWAANWSPDGRYLAFFSDRDGIARPWIWDKRSGRLRSLGIAPINPGFVLEPPQWMPDSGHIVIRVLPEHMKLEDILNMAYGPRRTTAPQQRQLSASVRVSETHSATESQPGSVESSRIFDLLLSDIGIVDVQNGEMHRVPTRSRVYSYALSPDGSYIALLSNSGQAALNLQRSLWQLYVISLRAGTVTTIASNLLWDLRPLSWSADSNSLVFSTSSIEGTPDVFLVPLDTKEVIKLTATRPTTFHKPLTFCFGECEWLWSPAGGSLWSVTENALWHLDIHDGRLTQTVEIPAVIIKGLIAARTRSLLLSQDEGRSALMLVQKRETLDEQIYKINLETGSYAPVWQEPKRVRTFYHAIDVSQNGTLVAWVAEDVQHPEDVWAGNVNSAEMKRVTRLNQQFDRYLLGTNQLISWRGLDGQSLKGSLLLPAGYEKGKTYPLIVWVYGGVLLSDQINRWRIWVGGAMSPQLLATRGYAVLFPDAPQRVGTPMRDLANTILPGVQNVVELGISDPERVGVIGSSYGGYSVLALLVQSNQFKAAVDIAGMSNLTSAYAKAGGAGGSIAWVENGQGLMGGPPWQYRDRFVENSPFFYLDRVQTPLLIIHGEVDPVVPVTEARMVFESLRRLEKEAVLAEYAGEGHGPDAWSYANQDDFCKRVIGWFDKYLKGQLQHQDSR